MKHQAKKWSLAQGKGSRLGWVILSPGVAETQEAVMLTERGHSPVAGNVWRATSSVGHKVCLLKVDWRLRIGSQCSSDSKMSYQVTAAASHSRQAADLTQEICSPHMGDKRLPLSEDEREP